MSDEPKHSESYIQPEKPQDTGDLGERNANGQFLPGHNGMSGEQPVTRKAQELKAALIAAVTVQDIQDIVKKQIQKAKTGDAKAAQFVCDRCCGKPTETHEHDHNVKMEPILIRYDDDRVQPNKEADSSGQTPAQPTDKPV